MIFRFDAFFQGGTRPGRRLCRYRTLLRVRFSESDIGQCYRCERLLWRTGAACCCIELYEQAFIYSSVLLLGEDSTLINNEYRDNLGYGIADAMGFDLFAFGFLRLRGVSGGLGVQKSSDLLFCIQR